MEPAHGTAGCVFSVIAADFCVRQMGLKKLVERYSGPGAEGVGGLSVSGSMAAQGRLLGDAYRSGITTRPAPGNLSNFATRRVQCYSVRLITNRFPNPVKSCCGAALSLERCSGLQNL